MTTRRTPRACSRDAPAWCRDEPPPAASIAVRGLGMGRYVGDRVLVASTRQPLLDGARALLAESADPDRPLRQRGRCAERGRDHRRAPYLRCRRVRAPLEAVCFAGRVAAHRVRRRSP
jgi:hypothetical protein